MMLPTASRRRSYSYPLIVVAALLLWLAMAGRGVAGELDSRRANAGPVTMIPRGFPRGKIRTPLSHKLEPIWTAILRDTLVKYHHGSGLDAFGTSVEGAMQAVSKVPFETRSRWRLSRILNQALGAKTSAARENTVEAVRWLERKYGLLDLPLLTPLDATRDGSYRTPEAVRYGVTAPQLPAAFAPDKPSSIVALDRYIDRKWGGLSQVAKPDHIVFSELGTHDTLTGLKQQGFRQFHLVNGAYSNRGSKTLLATSAKDAAPTLAFFAFVGRDLFAHKLMQLRVAFPETFKQMKVLTSDNFKSWDVAKLVVKRAINALPKDPIDDLVVGYTDVIEQRLKQRMKDGWVERLHQCTLPDDIARVAYYKVKGKTGFPRTVALLGDVMYRYFGSSVEPLVEAFLDRGVDRLLFAGSAGLLDRELPLHAATIARSFHEQDPNTGNLSTIDIANELFQTAPYGAGFSGRHVSVVSPLIESRKMIDDLRAKDVLSVDVEMARNARLLAAANKANPRHKTRYVALGIGTDFPLGSGDPEQSNVGLHNPDYQSKARTKARYADFLDLLWDIPGKYGPSYHTRVIGEHWANQIREYLDQDNSVALGWIRGELQSRLRAAQDHAAADRRTSRGLIKTYGDLMRVLDRAGIVPLELDPVDSSSDFLPRIPQLNRNLQRALLLQSMTRSATLNSGDRGQRGEKLTATRTAALRNAEQVVDHILETPDRSLVRSEIERLHATLTKNILPAGEQGRIRRFSYRPVSGPEISSEQVWSDLTKWLEQVEPTPKSSVEAFRRVEQFHGFEDGSGRIAEIAAQQTMLRATAHPLVWPSRFDIDYIMTLERNGPNARSKQQFLTRLVADSLRVSKWLGRYVAEVDNVHYTADGRVAVQTPSGEQRTIIPHIRTDKRFRLEREQREFLEPGSEPLLTRTEGALIDQLTVPQREFQLVYGLYSIGHLGRY